jgi:hypothetical protein
MDIVLGLLIGPDPGTLCCKLEDDSGKLELEVAIVED